LENSRQHQARCGRLWRDWLVDLLGVMSQVPGESDYRTNVFRQMFFGRLFGVKTKLLVQTPISKYLAGIDRWRDRHYQGKQKGDLGSGTIKNQAAPLASPFVYFQAQEFLDPYRKRRRNAFIGTKVFRV
jgi:hypothetical protein